MAPTALWPFNKCPIAVLTATVAITNDHNVAVAVSFETATNPVHISSRILYVFLLCIVIIIVNFWALRSLGVSAVLSAQYKI